MSTNKPTENEDEYFAREDAEARKKLAYEQAQKLAAAEREHMKQLHYMHCPKCGMTLETHTFKEVQIEKCHHCRGVWLDDGELDRLAGKEAGFIHRLVAVFK